MVSTKLLSFYQRVSTKNIRRFFFREEQVRSELSIPPRPKNTTLYPHTATMIPRRINNYSYLTSTVRLAMLRTFSMGQPGSRPLATSDICGTY